MANDKSYSITFIEGLPITLRGVVFLESEEDSRVDAKKVFDALKQTKGGKDQERLILNRFSLWINGGRHDKYHHGWPNEPENKHCYVFKWKHRQRDNRFYGFLCNPKPKTDARLQICVLVSHDYKNQRLTDPRHKALANELRETQSVKDAIAEQFPDV